MNVTIVHAVIDKYVLQTARSLASAGDATAALNEGQNTHRKIAPEFLSHFDIYLGLLT